MPGMFGGIHARPGVLRVLVDEFRAAVPGVRIVDVDGGIIGAHAHAARTAASEMVTAAGPAALAVDGDVGLYVAFDALARSDAPPSPDTQRLVAHLQASGIGNVAVVEAGASAVSLHTEWSGSFPLYFVESAGGLLFSSLARPLARAHSSELDLVGITEFLRAGYTMAGRTPFTGIQRLQPGQVLRYRPGQEARIEDCSRLWVGQDTSLDAETAGAAAWEALSDSVCRTREQRGSSALMMSAGWDSRTLLALEIAAGGCEHLLGYSHGDVNSRELRLARDISHEAGIRADLQPIDEQVLAPELLDSGFLASETLVFPHWHASGRLLAARGIEHVSAGVFGEILGGHYGLTVVTAGLGKISALLRSLSDRSTSDVSLESGLETVRDLLRIDSVQDQWYFAPDFAAELAASQVAEAINTDIETDLAQLLTRGVATSTQLLEAFVSEHRGSQYVNAQLLSVRPHCDVSLPFADRAALEVATRIPANVKLHNLVNQAMLRRHWPRSLKYPMAATLVPARAPLLLQEASRAVRKVGETMAWSLSSFSRGLYPRPRFSWVDFEFLRGSEGLARLSSRFTHGIWDQGRIEKAITSISHGGPRASAHPLYDQLGKMLTIQKWLETRGA